MRPAGRSVAVAAVLAVGLVAGCTGPAGRASQGPTVTPAPVPETAVPTPATPAVEGRLDDPAFLADRLEAALSEPFTVRANQTVRYANGTRRASTRMVLVVRPNGSFFLSLARRGASAPAGMDVTHAEYYYDGDRYYRAFTRNGTTTYSTFFSSPYVGTALYWYRLVLPGGQPREDIARLVGALDVRSAGTVRRNGTRLYRIRSVGVADGAAFAAAEGVSNPRNVTFRATLGPHGALRAYRLSYTAVLDGDRISVDRRVRYDLDESDGLEPPAWYDEARAALDRSDASGTNRSGTGRFAGRSRA